jgi:hypothetical protein
MITLEQVKLLESRVEKALDYIDSLKAENGELRGKLAGYQTRIDDLEILIRDFRKDQARIEEGIQTAITRLSDIEGGAVEEPASAGAATDTAAEEADATPATIEAAGAEESAAPRAGSLGLADEPKAPRSPYTALEEDSDAESESEEPEESAQAPATGQLDIF